MAKSYTQLRTTYGKDTKNTSADNLSYGDEKMNDYHRRILSKYDWPFLHRRRTILTQTSEFVTLPYDIDLVESVSITVGSTRYTPEPVSSREQWDKLHYSTYSSDSPERWFVYDGKLGIWPKPSTAGNNIDISGKIRVIDLNVADYTTGTITSISNGGTTVIGSGTSWTSPMIGRWIRITSDDGTDSGDGLWYEIASVTNTTTLELVRAYGGTSITAGSQAYTIGMMPQLPEAYHDLPLLHANYMYWSKEKDSTRASIFKNERDEVLKDLMSSYGVTDLSMVVDDGEDDYMINPNLLVELS